MTRISTPFTLVRQELHKSAKNSKKFETIVGGCHPTGAMATEHVSKSIPARDSIPEHKSTSPTVVAHNLQLLAFIVSLCRATNTPPSQILIKALEFDATITQN